MNTEIYRELALRISNIGDNEYRLAVSKAQNKSNVNEIVELIQDHRKPYTEGRVASMGTAVFASPEVWAQIAAESEDAAKRELLADSAMLAEVTDLERKARSAQEEAERKSRELQALWNEYNAAPDKIEAIEKRLADIMNELKSLDIDKLEADFRKAYRDTLNGALNDVLGLTIQAGLIATAPLRVEVLNELTSELQAELGELKSRQKVVAKKLGRRA